jgi:replicative DNA helicase
MNTENISEHLQDSLVYLSITDSEFLRIIIGQVPSEYFTSESAKFVYEVCSEYFSKIEKAPKDHIHDEIFKESSKLNPDEKELLARYLLYIQKMNPPNKEYILSRLDDFIRCQAYIKATYQFAELVQKGQFSKATYLMQKTLKSGINQNSATTEFLSSECTRKETPERVFPLGISELDKYIRLERSDLITIAGPYKGCKSWFGHHIGKMALLSGLTVLHVSHENSQEDTTIRYDMMFGGLISHQKEPAEVSLRYMENRKIYIEDGVLRESVYNKEQVLKYRKKMKSYGGKLLITKYPMGTCTPIELDSYIEKLSNEGIVPDVVINDYADIMSPIDRNKQTRDAINEIYIYLKRIADDRKLIMVTMSQINDEGIRHLINKGKLEGYHLAEDKRKFANIDKGLFVGTTPKLEEENEYIVGCFANRNGVQGVRCVIGMNLPIGQFCCYSYPYDKRKED